MHPWINVITSDWFIMVHPFAVCTTNLGSITSAGLPQSMLYIYRSFGCFQPRGHHGMKEQIPDHPEWLTILIVVRIVNREDSFIAESCIQSCGDVGCFYCFTTARKTQSWLLSFLLQTKYMMIFSSRVSHALWARTRWSSVALPLRLILLVHACPKTS